MKWPVIGVLSAIAITTTMDATGLSVFSALPLLVLTILFCVIQKISRRDIGLTFGAARYYGLGPLHAIAVLGALAATAFALGAVHVGSFPNGAWIKVAINTTAGTLAVMLTEEGFFRGWLWASLQRRQLLLTSLAFMLWHISAVVLKTGFNPPMAQVPVFLANAFVLGIIWGRMRQVSDSIVVSSFAHSLWNALAYRLFGFGEKVGVLGIQQTWLYGPEVGVAGLALNVAFALVLWLSSRR